MYKFFLYTSVLTLIYFIMWVGLESVQIKVVLAIIGLTFLPKIRKNLYQPSLVIRKSKVALYASLFFTFLLTILDINLLVTGPIINLTVPFLVLFYCLLGSIIYGIPVSLLADLVTANARKYRVYLSFSVHIGFGLLSYFFLGPLMILAAIITVLFFLIDELLRKKELVTF